MVDFLEVADRVWVARYPWADANVTAIGSDRGVVVVDTHGSTERGRTILGDLARLGAGDVVAVVNTHWHWDHSFGNAAFREVDPEVPIHAHENAATWLAEHGEATKARFTPETDLEHHEEVHLYTAGTMGPKEADRLAADAGGWITPLPPADR